jgi:F0F1-type ATP synthase assembly protein I
MKPSLDKKISAFEKSREREPSMFANMRSGAGRAAYEFLVPIVFFGVVGFLIDVQLGTTPWITLGLFFLGFATGLYNAWKDVTYSSERVGFVHKAQEPKIGDNPVDKPSDNLNK